MQGIDGSGCCSCPISRDVPPNPNIDVPDTIQNIRKCTQSLTNTYGQRQGGIEQTVKEPFILIKELASVALLGALETKADFGSLLLASHKLPITTGFEELAVDAIALDTRLERSEKMVEKAAHNVSKDAANK